MHHKSAASTCPSCVDVQLGQRQCEGQLSSLGVSGTLQDVVQGVPPSCPARGDEVCIRCLNIRHRTCIIHTATPAGREEFIICVYYVIYHSPVCRRLYDIIHIYIIIHGARRSTGIVFHFNNNLVSNLSSYDDIVILH